MTRDTHKRHIAIWRALAVLAASALCASMASANESITPDDVKGPFQWGAASRVTQLRHLYFADQPDRAGLESARDAGVAIVINMRAPSEIDWGEQAAVEELGMSYVNVPVTGRSFDPDQFEKIESTIAAHPNEKILVHCGSSNRVGGWLTTHLVTRHDMSEADALAVGRRAGITNPGIEKRVHAYLEARELK